MSGSVPHPAERDVLRGPAGVSLRTVRRTGILWFTLPILLCSTACTDAERDGFRSQPGGGGAPPSAAAGRPQACTAEIVNTYFEQPRFTGPGDTFDPEATVRNTAELLSADCAAEPDRCVRQVIDTVNRTGESPRAAAVSAYQSSAACVGDQEEPAPSR